MAMEIIENSRYSCNIYTDASVSSEGKTGIGIYLLHREKNFSHKIGLRINDNTPIFKAELFAFYYSLLTLSFMSIEDPISIFCDSLSVINSIESGHSKTNNNLLQLILFQLNQSKHAISVIWIPSHIGIPGNDLVDKIASDSSIYPEIDIILPWETPEIKPFITKYIKDLQQNAWDKSSTQYRSIHPNIHSVAPLFLPQLLETQIARLKLGKCFLNFYSHQINKHPTGLCDLCNQPETIEHYLLRCVNPTATKLATWSIKNNKPLDLITALTDPEAIHIISCNIIRRL
jgi:ribonuclease HI